MIKALFKALLKINSGSLDLSKRVDGYKSVYFRALFTFDANDKLTLLAGKSAQLELATKLTAGAQSD